MQRGCDFHGELFKGWYQVCGLKAEEEWKKEDIKMAEM